MFKFILVVLSLSFTLSYYESQASCPCDSQKILNDKIPFYNKRYGTFALALDLLSIRKASILVETGTARNGLANCSGDGCSTIIFAEWVKNNGGKLYSIDINAENLQAAANALGDAASSVHLVHSDSIAFLRNFNHPIDFLYLDSCDLDFFNPIPSQEHHLQEIIAAYPWLTQNSIVMIDDSETYLPGGGKGKLVIDFLMAKGWGILAHGYQVILVKP
jgi:hypothetical protein